RAGSVNDSLTKRARLLLENGVQADESSEYTADSADETGDGPNPWNPPSSYFMSRLNLRPDGCLHRVNARRGQVPLARLAALHPILVALFLAVPRNLWVHDVEAVSLSQQPVRSERFKFLVDFVSFMPVAVLNLVPRVLRGSL